MSCDIRWDSVENQHFQRWTKELLYDSLNSGKRPHILSSEIQIKDLAFGSSSPKIEVLEIGDLANDKFRGIFKLKYDGDAQITLSTSIQANLLNIYEKSTQELGGDFALPKFKLSSQPFSMPLFVNLSNIRLSGIIIVVFSKTKGLTLVFKNDPLEGIKVSSSFDNVQVIEKFLQQKIEHQIRDLFRDILPSVLHKVSQKWTTANLINELHSKLNDSHAEKVEKLSIFEINPSEPEISPANMLKLSTLNTSRQSLTLSVPPFHDVIERCTMSKHENNVIKLNGNSKNSKTIPIEILTRNKGSKLDETLAQITKIQSKVYSNENSKNKVKRRRIKLSPAKKSYEPESMSSDSTVVGEDEPKHLMEPISEESQPLTSEIRNEIMSSDPVKLPPRSPELVSRFNQIPQRPKISHRISVSSPQPLIFEKFPALNTPLNSLNSLKSAEYFHHHPTRAHSPRRSQSNLLSVGLGNSWMEAPPPYY
jgi:distribution and morphology protein 34